MLVLYLRSVISEGPDSGGDKLVCLQWSLCEGPDRSVCGSSDPSEVCMTELLRRGYLPLALPFGDTSPLQMESWNLGGLL